MKSALKERVVIGVIQRYLLTLIVSCVAVPAILVAAAAEDRADVVLQINYDSVKESAAQFIRNEMKKTDAIGLSIALVDNQRLVWAQGFGYANIRKDQAATPDTVYRIGSLTKIFTTLAAMQLSEQGKLNIDAPLKSLLPEFAIRTRFETKRRLPFVISLPTIPDCRPTSKKGCGAKIRIPFQPLPG